MLGEETEYGGFLIRLAAAFVDGLLFWGASALMLLPIYGDQIFAKETLFLGTADVVVSLVLPAVVTIVFWRVRQATPGKLATRLCVVDSESGDTLSIGKCVVRYLGYTLSALPLGLGYLWVIWDPRRQAWHDKLAGSVVVRKQIV